MSTHLDDNRERVAYAVTDDANLTPEPLRVDPATDRLLIDLKATTPGSDTPNARLDENYETVFLLVEDDSGLAVVPALCDADGRLICDVSVE